LRHGRIRLLKATQSYSNVMTAFPMITVSAVPAGAPTGTAYVTIAVTSASPGWSAYPGSSHPVHLGVTYVPAGSTTPATGTCPSNGSCAFGVWGSFTTTTLTVQLPNFALAPQSLGIDLSDDPQDGAFTWDIANVQPTVTVVPD